MTVRDDHCGKLVIQISTGDNERHATHQLQQNTLSFSSELQAHTGQQARGRNRCTNYRNVRTNTCKQRRMSAIFLVSSISNRKSSFPLRLRTYLITAWHTKIVKVCLCMNSSHFSLLTSVSFNISISNCVEKSLLGFQIQPIWYFIPRLKWWYHIDPDLSVTNLETFPSLPFNTKLFPFEVEEACTQFL